MKRSPAGSLKALASFLAALSLAGSARAQDAVPTPFLHNYGETETPRTAALGGAARALGNGTSGLFLNPASITLNRVYHVEGILSFTPEAGRFMGGGAIVDSLSNRYRLAGGIAVFGGFQDAGESEWSTFDLRAALAYPIGDKLHIGVAPRYASLTHATPTTDESDPDQEDRAQLNLHAFTLDAGITLRATDALHVSFVGQNVASNHRGTFPILLGGGIGYGNELFSLEVNGLADLDSYASVTTRLMGGAEVMLADRVPVRLGYRFDQGAKLHALSGGLGYVGTQFAIEASVRRTLSDPGATMISVGLAYFVETAGFMKAATEGNEL